MERKEEKKSNDKNKWDTLILFKKKSNGNISFESFIRISSEKKQPLKY